MCSRVPPHLFRASRRDKTNRAELLFCSECFCFCGAERTAPPAHSEVQHYVIKLVNTQSFPALNSLGLIRSPDINLKHKEEHLFIICEVLLIIIPLK